MPLAALTRELAEEIAREFPGLQRLNLSRNALRDFEHLRLLPHLAHLDLSHNALRVLPADLGAWLPRLARLNLRGNAMYVAPIRADGGSVPLARFAYTVLALVCPLASRWRAWRGARGLRSWMRATTAWSYWASCGSWCRLTSLRSWHWTGTRSRRGTRARSAARRWRCCRACVCSTASAFKSFRV